MDEGEKLPKQTENGFLSSAKKSSPVHLVNFKYEISRFLLIKMEQKKGSVSTVFYIRFS